MAEKGKAKRALEVTMVARRTHLLRVLREVGVVGGKLATREGAIRFREALEELGPTFVKLGQLLSSRPDLLPDVYIEELTKLVDDVPRPAGRARPRAAAQDRVDRREALEHGAPPAAERTRGRARAAPARRAELHRRGAQPRADRVGDRRVQTRSCTSRT